MYSVPSVSARLALAAIALGVIAAACSDADVHTSPVQKLESVSMTTIPVPPAGASDIRGVVIHSTAQGASLGTIAGARIAVSRVEIDGSSTDTATAQKVLIPITTITSAADGSFELRNVGRGYFALDVEPPSGAGLEPGRAWSVSLLPTDPARAQVFIYSAQ